MTAATRTPPDEQLVRQLADVTPEMTLHAEETCAVQRLQGLGTPRGLGDERWARTLGTTLRALEKAGWR